MTRRGGRRASARGALAFRCRAKRRRPAALTAGLIGALLIGGVVGLPGTAVAGASARSYPLILDVDLTPNPSCSRTVRGRVMVYDPVGAKTGADVAWRMRVGGHRLVGGTVVMNRSVAVAEFEIPAREVPSTAAVAVDARELRTAADGGPGAYGKPWRETISRGCHPVRVAAVGDSVVWGQGLDHEQKFPYLTGELLGRATGRGLEFHDYSISGAVLDAPELPAGNHDAACRERTEQQDPDDDGEMEFGEVTQQMPDVFCQLERAGAQARAGGYGLDLVVLNGCINDIDPFFGIAAGITPGSEDVAPSVRRECEGIGAAPENPAKDVPYFSGAKVGYGGRGIRQAIEKAHSLPGHPKVVVVNFYYALSRESSLLPATRCAVPGLEGARLARCKRALGTIKPARRYEQYTQLVAEAYRKAAEAANRASQDGPYAVAADGLFTLDTAINAPRTTVWGSPSADPAYPLRKLACPEFSPTPVQCLSAAMAHPDIHGARQYAENFLLNSRIRQWFGLPATGPKLSLTVAGDGHPAGSVVRFTAARTGTKAAAGARYHWYFGDGTELRTDAPAATHVYDHEGPYLPRLVVTDSAGRRTLTEARSPLTVTPAR